ncbi:MAG: DUF1501 domain-containing protein, partial [Planctomycetota bacterium]|nr:DUF1501 domain-containing protein [Planctomycetota bacterium]MED5286820.1 DUF1501 domain-containing protein [Planctomycetota bacterium]
MNPDLSSSERSSRRHFMSRLAMGSIPIALASSSLKIRAEDPVKPDLGVPRFDLTPKLPPKPP